MSSESVPGRCGLPQCPAPTGRGPDIEHAESCGASSGIHLFCFGERRHPEWSRKTIRLGWLARAVFVFGIP